MELDKNIYRISYSDISIKTCAPTGNRLQHDGPAISTLKNMRIICYFFLLIPPWEGVHDPEELTDFSNWKNNLDITLLDLDQNDS